MGPSQREFDYIFDAHIHLRQGEMCEMVTRHLENVDTVYVMPNLVPPITTTKLAVDYRNKLKSIRGDITFLMTLYLHPGLTPSEIVKAKEAGISGVKLYPRGVTTNSELGVTDYKVFYPVFEQMAKSGMVLNIHGETGDDSVFDAERKFLRHLKEIHNRFPNLKIVLEHVSTRESVEMVKSLNENVAATITIHHLLLTTGDWVTDTHCYCKPVAKTPEDRESLREVIRNGNPKFFFGSDSAPHSRERKETENPAAGVYTGRYLAGYLLSTLTEIGAIEHYDNFANNFGRAFYGLPPPYQRTFKVADLTLDIPKELTNGNGDITIVPFKAGTQLKIE